MDLSHGVHVPPVGLFTTIDCCVGLRKTFCFMPGSSTRRISPTDRQISGKLLVNRVRMVVQLYSSIHVMSFTKGPDDGLGLHNFVVFGSCDYVELVQGSLCPV